MSIPQSILYKEIKKRIGKTRREMKNRGYDALIIYGDNKIYGSLRYLTDYFPDRAGWTSLSATDIYNFGGAALILLSEGEPVLLLDPGMVLSKEVATNRVLVGGLSADKETSLTPEGIIRILKDADVKGTVGIETWDRFPISLYLGLKEQLSGVEFKRSTIVEELRLVKSVMEVEIMRKGGLIGDMAHQAVVDVLRDDIAKTELELIRVAEQIMRNADPIYEDFCTNSPSLICSGFAVANNLLHHPQQSKIIRKGDVVHWDICHRFQGYSIDTSRTKVVGKPTDLQLRAYETTLLMYEEVLKDAKPGVKAVKLVETAIRVAREEGFELWDNFLGHGTGIDAHERPDLVKEETRLIENMILAIEPRISIDNMYLVGLEDMVLITKSGAVSLNQFERESLEL